MMDISKGETPMTNTERFRQRLTEMKARHARTDRELEQINRDCWTLFDQMNKAHDALEAELTD